MKFFNKLRGLNLKKSAARHDELDHNRILENCNDVRQILCQKLLLAAKTLQEKDNAEKLLKEAKMARAFIPITIAKRQLIQPLITRRI